MTGTPSTSRIAHRASRLVLATAFLLALAAPAAAQSAGAFARLGFGARAAAMGGGQTGDVFGSASAYYNPALAPFASAAALEASGTLLSMDRQVQHVQVVAPLRPRAGIAAGIVHAGVRGIDGRDGSGYPTGELSTDEYAFFVAFGTRLTERVSGGVGLRFYRSSLFEGVSANALGVSLGLAARVTEQIAVGFAVDDLLAGYDWDTSEIGGGATTDRFPVRLRLGGAYQLPAGRGTLTAEVETRVEQAETRTGTFDPIGGLPGTLSERETLRLVGANVRVGGEVWLAEPFALRAGVDRLGDGGLGGATPSAGFAVRQRLGELDARLDYAAILEPYAEGVMHAVTVRVEL